MYNPNDKKINSYMTMIVSINVVLGLIILVTMSWWAIPLIPIAVIATNILYKKALNRVTELSKLPKVFKDNMGRIIITNVEYRTC